LRLPGVESFHPLSPMQQGMLFHSLSAPDSALYWQQVTLTLEGQLDVALLKRSWDLIIERHAVLRSYFVWEGLKEPVQVVQQQVGLPTEEHDWRSLDAGRRSAELEALLDADRRKGCPLDKPPLLRLAVVHLGEDLQYVIWSFHHVILDGWSVYHVLKDVFENYEALRRGEPMRWAPVRPYQDYIAWLRSQDLSRAEAFWRRELSGLPGPTAVADALAPVGQAVGDGRIVEVDTQVVRLDEAASAAAQAFARQHRLTLNTLLQGAWAVLLSRYAGQDDVCFGGTVSGRPPGVQGVDSMVGMFINTLPVRTRVPPRAELLPWLQELQDRQADARQYDWTPLVEIQGWSGVPRDVPLFDSIFIFANYPVELWSSLGSGSLRVKGYRAWESTNYALNAFAEPGPQLALGLFYDRDRCERAAVGRMLGHWRTLLEAMIRNPRARLAELPILGEEEIAELERWNATTEDYDRACLPDLFEAQVARTPAAPAVSFAGETLSYRELNRRANQLAHALRELGVAPGILVGIYMERSQDMLVALLGVLKAGGAYVPLDPAYPRERVSYMLQDSGTTILLTQQALLGTLPEPAPRVVCVDARSSEAGAARDVDPPRTVGPDDLAYVIYTSGSTGRPKGVQVTHRGLVNFLSSMRRQPGVSERDTLLSVTTLSFDIAGLELYLPLIAGGRVVLASRDEAADGQMLLGKLKAFDVTMMQATPATWRLLLETEWEMRDSLKVLCGGESLTRDLADRLLERGASLWNLYGPTETTIWSTLAKVEAGGPVTIGRPIANTRVHVLDGQGARVPVGVAGELCIGGDGLARGYLKRPELTAERFVPDAFGPERGARLYRTGDLARYLPDGGIEWLGRGDHQVKLRGYRIELGEIESLLGGHPEVRAAVAVLREDVPGDPRLTGYVVPREPRAEPSDEGAAQPGLASRLRAHLRESLPDFMVPATFVLLDGLPLTPNGKVDRKALPKPEERSSAAVYVEPETDTDRTIAAVWQEVLRLERVGLHDNFFDFGGHSLLLMQVQGRLRRVLSRDIPIVELFRHPTVASLSRYLREGPDGQGGPRPDGSIEKLQAGRVRLDRLHQRRQSVRQGNRWTS
jgi:amino acid adenylation domain-containing protein